MIRYSVDFGSPGRSKSLASPRLVSVGDPKFAGFRIGSDAKPSLAGELVVTVDIRRPIVRRIRIRGIIARRAGVCRGAVLHFLGRAGLRGGCDGLLGKHFFRVEQVCIPAQLLEQVGGKVLPDFEEECAAPLLFRIPGFFKILLRLFEIAAHPTAVPALAHGGGHNGRQQLVQAGTLAGARDGLLDRFDQILDELIRFALGDGCGVGAGKSLGVKPLDPGEGGAQSV